MKKAEERSQSGELPNATNQILPSPPFRPLHKPPTVRLHNPPQKLQQKYPHKRVPALVRVMNHNPHQTAPQPTTSPFGRIRKAFVFVPQFPASVTKIVASPFLPLRSTPAVESVQANPESAHAPASGMKADSTAKIAEAPPPPPPPK